MLHYCVNNYYVATFALEDASLKMETDPGPVMKQSVKF
jgi:hypothetical protein